MTDLHPTELSHEAAVWMERLAAEGLEASLDSRLQNGLRASVTDGARSCRVNLYFSRARGFSVVFAGGDRDLAVRVCRRGDASCTGGLWPRIGCDEAGKGDYLGPLVAAAARLDEAAAAALLNAGLADSKTLSDDRVLRLDAMLSGTGGACVSLVVMAPELYNRWIEERAHAGRNSLDMLSEAHGSALKGLLERCGAAPMAVLDRFAPDSRILPHMPEGQRIELRTHAESDPAVAAASIAARAAYLRWLEEASASLGVRLVAGSAAGADQAAREVVERHGAAALAGVAKLHFRNTLKVLGHPGP